LEAEVELRAGMQQEWLALAEFLSRRAALPTAALLTRIRFARQPLCCAHARLPLRRAGDYPVAIVSASARLAEDGRIDELRLAVGSVESVAKRWPRLEAFARGRRLDPEEMASAAELFREDFTGRDGVEAEGWYRIQVLPALVRRAARSLMQPI
jgi:carbon-monoxide dehydrogenase medium subunit